MKIIAIETSHDDTSVVIYKDKKILYEFSYTQTEFHKQFGGTVPEYASRGHFDKLPFILEKMKNQDLLKNIDLIAYTSHPGLIGSLHMGTIFAKALSISLNVPLRPINHMHGHIFAVAFNAKIVFPALALIISGGHTQIWKVDSYHDLKILGETKDDAVGEVYDKIARKMKLSFPGGPIIDKLAKKGQKKYDFSIKDDKTYNMSFSGLKTKVINTINSLNQKGIKGFECDIAASFQESIVNIFKTKIKRAIKEFNPSSIILGGGVSANSKIRKEFFNWHDIICIPNMEYTTDNAMMIAITADLKEKNKN